MSIAQAALRDPQLAWESYNGQKAQAEAHLEHAAHVCDAGGIKAQRLVESNRRLPSPKGESDRGKRVMARRWHRGKGSARGVRVAQLGSACGQKAQADAHIKHVAHVRDAGGVKAQRLVESFRALPSPKRASDTYIEGNA